jgi:hypothetical protein
MNRAEIKKLIKEAFTDKVYGSYPYSHNQGEEDQPGPDYAEEWKSFSEGISNDPKKDKLIELCQLLVDDNEVLKDVLDVLGEHRDVASNIMRTLQERKTLTTV